MPSKQEIKDQLRSAFDSLKETEAAQQVKAKWEELDPQSRIYLKFAAYGGGVLFAFSLILSAVWGVHSTKSDYLQKRQLLNEIQLANDEIRRLKDTLPPSAQQASAPGSAQSLKANEPWSTHFETIASQSTIDKSSLVISPEKAGTVGDQTREALYDIALKHVSIKQVVRMAFNLENGSRPVKLRNLAIDTNADPEGFMDATLSISAFTVVIPK